MVIHQTNQDAHSPCVSPGQSDQSLVTLTMDQLVDACWLFHYCPGPSGHHHHCPSLSAKRTRLNWPITIQLYQIESPADCAQSSSLSLMMASFCALSHLMMKFSRIRAVKRFKPITTETMNHMMKKTWLHSPAQLGLKNQRSCCRRRCFSCRA